MISYVVAMDKNNVIGKDNALPWHLPNDLQKFKTITTSKSQTIIMGRKTFESLPNILPDRHHIVLTRDKNYKIEDHRVTVVNKIKDIELLAADNKEYFVIGGGEIFNLLFPYAEKMYITKIDEDFKGDTFFPKYYGTEWEIIEEKKGLVDENNKYEHKFIVLQRI
ncbi:dihydrofolate reductase [Clostridium magnum]|uniref:Dihydrofolate reductase n=1 Tax=Clostridium magnum DSM 2767 TaxID=1121326 RepID=A0A162T1D7_9CLOT|nr:dihydrofolate reductase [Clostridium magnum]KZL92124.1 dihydrofolate reductase [Clostridium magnum DSM 2767]SHH21440.1 dihydrofolate reductase [Clostridium magnum DSM 2767]